MNLSDLNPILKHLSLDPLARGLVLVDGAELAADSFPRIDTDRPALVMHVDTMNLKEIARTLRVNYPASHPISLLHNNRVKRLTLSEVTPDFKIARNTILYVPPLAHPGSPLTVANIMARLRAPAGGCPWDLEQTHESITRALVEETYEVIEAISDQDAPHLREELGDLLLHVLFQTQIARDDNEFALSDVGAELAAKLIRRHPHVFGDAEAQGTAWVLENWEKIKQEEKKDKGQSAGADALDAGIPRNLPAVVRAQKVAERAQSKYGKPAISRGQGSKGGRQASAGSIKQTITRARDRERVVGELLLEIAQIASAHGIDAERALNAANKAFVQKNRE